MPPDERRMLQRRNKPGWRGLKRGEKKRAELMLSRRSPDEMEVAQSMSRHWARACFASQAVRPYTMTHQISHAHEAICLRWQGKLVTLCVMNTHLRLPKCRCHVCRGNISGQCRCVVL